MPPCVFFFFYLSNHPTHRRKTYKPYSIAAVWKSTASPYEVTLPYTLTLGKQPQAVIQVERGRIRYLSAECPDGLCVKSGWLSQPGDTAACLPARTVIAIEGIRPAGGVDVQTY